MRFAAPEDFRVEEVPLFAPSGEGEHTYVHVEKVGRTTEEVARALARAAGVRPRDVGYAGRKDRFAVATQWLSVPGLVPELATQLALPGCKVLAAVRHTHKLRTGQLAGNRFDLLLRGVARAVAEEASAKLAELVARGLSNRFGGQRFGRDGDNAEQGRRVMLGEQRVRDRRQARFLASAYQARVFNAVLANRTGALDRLETGDVAVVHASGGLFHIEAAALEQPRADRFEISATGPIFGNRSEEPRGEPGERERALFEAHGVAEALAAARGLRLRGGRRALRVQPMEASAVQVAEGLRLRFVLPPGSYATVLVDELLGPEPIPSA
ncbi:MAG: tRNA pseudouridine(13) synthase TruD [Deltaproteobacteria bacterium]|nr:tRNA pseudouridine(13) synthase TruD [Deltaproteobacteria bacterium]MBW2359771.1 tRNA pseudouridine(13) synthase TruD [Deltaproteobacteria bacterium]